MLGAHESPVSDGVSSRRLSRYLASPRFASLRHLDNPTPSVGITCQSPKRIARKREKSNLTPMKILFICEAVTLAHSARPVALASFAARAGHDVVIAGAADVTQKQTRFGAEWRGLTTIGPARFSAALRAGRPVFTFADLDSYVAEDLRLIKATSPDLIVGDFRLSLCVSARLAGIRYAAITNAYWGAGCTQPMPMPELPMTRVLPLPVAQALFRLGSPWVMPLHCRPMNRLRARHGMPSLGNDLRAVYTDADDLLYADIPGMFASQEMPANHHFIGPIFWAPEIDLPIWWNDLPTTKPVVYVTMGSSGSPQVLQGVLKCLAELPVTVIASTAGADVSTLPDCPNLYLAPYLQGEQAARRAALVVCNGGSMACQQAFAAGKPVLGIASNMDQFLNMAGVMDVQAGLCLRADRVAPKTLKQAIHTMIDSPVFRRSAQVLGNRQREYNSAERFLRFLSGRAS